VHKEYQRRDIVITLNVAPNARNSSVKGISEEEVSLSICQPPVDGKANEEVVEYISGLLGVKKRQVTLDKGSKSRNKVVVVTGEISREEVYHKLLQASSS